MRIALVGAGLLPIPPIGYGAVERHIWELSQHLARRGHEVHILNRVFGSEYRFIPWVLGQLRALKPEIVHVHTSALGAALSLLLDSVVFTSHNPAWTAEGLDLLSRWGLTLEKVVARRASAFITLDERTLERAQAYAAHPYVVHGAIDASQWDVSSLDGGYALSVGKVDKRKGFHKFAEQRGDIPYIVAGKSVGDVAYENRLRDLGVQLELNPSDHRVRQLLSRASVYVHPSEFDAFSLAVLEAMASGLPVVASEVCREQVLDGVNGFLVEGDAYIEPVRRLAEDSVLRRRMGKKSRERVVRNFSWDAVGDSIIVVYQKVLGLA